MPMLEFNCDMCGAPSAKKAAWYRKATRHYCSRSCANKHQAILNPRAMPRKEYEKQYWSRPENAERRKEMSRSALERRQAEMGESFRRQVLARCKSRAERRGLEFNLTIDDIVIPEFCPALGIKLSVTRGQGGSACSPSVDRVDASRGYVKGNVQVISKRANSIKSDATAEEIEKIAMWLRSLS